MVISGLCFSENQPAQSGNTKIHKFSFEGLPWFVLAHASHISPARKARVDLFISSCSAVRFDLFHRRPADPPLCIMGCRPRSPTAAVAVRSPDSHSNETHQKQPRRQGSSRRRRRRRGQRGRTKPDDGNKLPHATANPTIDVLFRVNNGGRVPSCDEAMKHLKSTARPGWCVRKISYDANTHLFTVAVTIANAQELDHISMKGRLARIGNTTLQPFMRCAGCNKLGTAMLLCGACKSVTYCGEDCQHFFVSDEVVITNYEQLQKSRKVRVDEERFRLDSFSAQRTISIIEAPHTARLALLVAQPHHIAA